MLVDNINDTLADLEKAELEAPEGGTSVQAYSQLLAIYLYKNELCSAKYLWKRIPKTLKNKCPELHQLWAVGQKMWQRDWPAIHTALNVEWNSNVANIMNVLKENVRERAMLLIADAYSSLDLSTVAAMTGLNIEEARQAVVERGWTVDGTTAQPCKRIEPPSFPVHSKLTEEQLFQLTEFVSFLEN